MIFLNRSVRMLSVAILSPFFTLPLKDRAQPHTLRSHRRRHYRRKKQNSHRLDQHHRDLLKDQRPTRLAHRHSQTLMTLT